MRYLLAKWIAVHGRPFVIIVDAELLAIFRMLYAKVEVPHPTTLSRDLREIFQISRAHLADQLEVSTTV